jgi:hypothetical protein
LHVILRCDDVIGQQGGSGGIGLFMRRPVVPVVVQELVILGGLMPSLMAVFHCMQKNFGPSLKHFIKIEQTNK